MNFEIRPIGHVRSPYKEKTDAPRQERLSDTFFFEIVIEEQYLSRL
jgi:tRNA (Thr-GGU) A37 N-methylase